MSTSKPAATRNDAESKSQPAPLPALGTAEEYFDRARSSAYNGKHADALADFTKAIELDPQNDLAYAGRGMAYEILGNYQLAISDCNKAIEADSEYATPYAVRGSAYENLGNHQLAVADCTKAIELDSQEYPAYVTRGKAYAELGKHQLAIADCTKAAELNPESAAIYNNRAFSHISLGNHQQAIADCTKAIELDPKLDDAYWNRAAAFDKTGDFKRAHADFKRAKTLYQQQNQPANAKDVEGHITRLEQQHPELRQAVVSDRGEVKVAAVPSATPIRAAAPAAQAAAKPAAAPAAESKSPAQPTTRFENFTALHQAAWNGDVAEINRLIAAGANLNAASVQINPDGSKLKPETALDIAKRLGKKEAIAALEAAMVSEQKSPTPTTAPRTPTLAEVEAASFAAAESKSPTTPTTPLSPAQAAAMAAISEHHYKAIAATPLATMEKMRDADSATITTLTKMRPDVAQYLDTNGLGAIEAEAQFKRIKQEPKTLLEYYTYLNRAFSAALMAGLAVQSGWVKNTSTTPVEDVINFVKNGAGSIHPMLEKAVGIVTSVVTFVKDRERTQGVANLTRQFPNAAQAAILAEVLARAATIKHADLIKAEHGRERGFVESAKAKLQWLKGGDVDNNVRCLAAKHAEALVNGLMAREKAGMLGFQDVAALLPLLEGHKIDTEHKEAAVAAIHVVAVAPGVMPVAVSQSGSRPPASPDSASRDELKAVEARYAAELQRLQQTFEQKLAAEKAEREAERARAAAEKAEQQAAIEMAVRRASTAEERTEAVRETLKDIVVEAGDQLAVNSQAGRAMGDAAKRLGAGTGALNDLQRKTREHDQAIGHLGSGTAINQDEVRQMRSQIQALEERIARESANKGCCTVS